MHCVPRRTSMASPLYYFPTLYMTNYALTSTLHADFALHGHRMVAQVSAAVQAGRNLQSKHHQNGVSSSYISRLITNNSADNPSATLRTFPQLPAVREHRKRAVASCIGGATGRAAHHCDRQPDGH